jgi:hypothetical protein
MYAFVGLREYLKHLNPAIENVQYDDPAVRDIILGLILTIQNPFFYLELTILFQVAYDMKISRLPGTPFPYLNLIGNIDDMLEEGSKRIVKNSLDLIDRVIIVGKKENQHPQANPLYDFLKKNAAVNCYVDNAYNQTDIYANKKKAKLPKGLCFPASILDGWSANGCTMSNIDNPDRVKIDTTDFDYTIQDERGNTQYRCITKIKRIGADLDRQGNSEVTISTTQLFSSVTSITISTNIFNPKEFSAGNVLKKQLDTLVQTIKAYNTETTNFWNYLSGGANLQQTIIDGLAKCSADMGQIMSAICFTDEARVQMSKDRACGTARPIVLMLASDQPSKAFLNPELFIGNGSGSDDYMGVLPLKFFQNPVGGKNKTRKIKKRKHKKTMKRKRLY